MTADIHTVTKLMAANLTEYASGVQRLTRDMTARTVNDATIIELSDGTVTITYTPKEGRRLSPLLVMPAADVALTFYGVAEVDRHAFIQKFDLVFQRGGG